MPWVVLRSPSAAPTAPTAAGPGGDRVGAQVVGIAFARYVVAIEPLASMSAAELVEAIAPAFQHYLVEPLY